MSSSLKPKEEPVSSVKSDRSMSSSLKPKEEPVSSAINPKEQLIKTDLRSSSVSSLSVLQEKNHDKSHDIDLEDNPDLTPEQKEEIMKQEEISQEIVKNIDYTFDKNDKDGEFQEINGPLSKKNKLGQWKEWHFCVVGNTLCYYESKKLLKKEGEIEISKIKSIGDLKSKKKKNQGKKFTINLDKSQMKLKAKNEAEAKNWVDYLNYVINMYQINNI